MNGWEKFHKYVGVQGILALIVTSAIIGWTSFEIVVPKEVWTLLGLAWGFYFAKNGSNIMAAAKK